MKTGHWPKNGTVGTIPGRVWDMSRTSATKTLSIHGVLHVDHKMKMLGTVLKHMVFLLVYAVHIFCPEHDTYAQFIYA